MYLFILFEGIGKSMPKQLDITGTKFVEQIPICILSLSLLGTNTLVQ